jgi:hypothetical protein
MDQPGFFGPGDDTRTDAVSRSTRARNSPPLRASRVALVAGGENFIDAMRFGEPLELRQRLQRGVHRFGGQRFAVETTGPESHHHFLAIDDLEREIGAYSNDDHVNRVGPDVDGGNAHDVSPTYSRSSCVSPS